MNEEMLESAVEDTEVIDGTPDIDLSAFDEGWEDASGPSSYNAETEPETEEEPEADQPEESEPEAQQDEKPADQPEPEQVEETKPEYADQRMTVKHLDSVREFDWVKDRDEIQTLVQKGMDYDRKAAYLSGQVDDYKSFLEEIAAPQHLTIDQLMDTTRARLFKSKEEREGREISETEALLAVQKQRSDKAAARKAEVEAAKKSQETAEQNKNMAMLQRFKNAYPDVKGTDIPRAVWDESNRTGDLVAAYAKHEIKQLKEQLAVYEQNKKNSERSIGSVRSTGSSKNRDAFDEGWDSIY